MSDSAWIKATWDTDKSPETKIDFSESFKDLSRIEILDFLKDIIGDLGELYDAELSRFGTVEKPN